MKAEILNRGFYGSGDWVLRIEGEGSAVVVAEKVADALGIPVQSRDGSILPKEARGEENN